ncbi:hypothetical protein [Nonomuraea wenchangensis]|uniref:Uncharacterized protein n=1 Tax=Nonomuraea wenchangensis TaxID=568860 RepID=A0A1I0EVT3_9ACTN|nr:hypothetical protein [Nonomuraea wenchangensis]SET49588.1 hypothetical protein SAMN05421811_103223 [Nonomuraea wenchangensis]
MPSERIDCASGRQKQVEMFWFPAPTRRVTLATIDRDAPSSDGLRFLGHGVTLDREGIDRLIGALCEARDTVYGSVDHEPRAGE